MALERQAKARGLSLSKYLAELAEKEVHQKQWSDAFWAVLGTFEGTIERPEQGEMEQREAF